MKYREADALARNSLADPAVEADSKQQFELDASLAESHLQMKQAALERLEDISNPQIEDTGDIWSTQLGVAEVYLSLGMAQQAMDSATKEADHFAATNQLDSELRSLCIAASASKALNGSADYKQFSKKIVDILSQLQQTWEPQALRSYLSRADLQTLMRGADVSAPLDRR